MHFKTILPGCLFLLAACNKPDEKATPLPAVHSDAAAGMPGCLQQKINAILTEPVRNPPARILRFSYNGDTVFYIPSYCCDHFSELYDGECNLICHPDGGLAGNGDGQCPTFWTTATDSVEIWRDPR